MNLTKKQLKQLNEINKKIKIEFPEEYYIFPNGKIYGKVGDRVSDRVYAEYERDISIIGDYKMSEVIIIYPSKVSLLFSQPKGERKIKMSDIGEPYIENSEIQVPLFNNEFSLIIGEVVTLDDVNISTFNNINRLFEEGFEPEERLSDDDYNRLLDKEMVVYTNDWFKILLNKNIFKTFTYRCINNIVKMKYKKIDEELRIFETVLTFTHIDNKTLEPLVSIKTRERGLY